MVDVMESANLVYEALKPLGAPDRERVMRAVDALLDDGQQPTRKPLPIPVERIEMPASSDRIKSPKASGGRQSNRSSGAVELKVFEAINAHPGAQVLDLVMSTGLGYSAIRSVCRQLLDKQAIRKEGETSQRRYYPAGPAQSSPSGRKPTAVPSLETLQAVASALTALRNNPSGLSTPKLASLIGIQPSSHLWRSMRVQLTSKGLARCTGKSAGAIWRILPQPSESSSGGAP